MAILIEVFGNDSATGAAVARQRKCWCFGRKRRRETIVHVIAIRAISNEHDVDIAISIGIPPSYATGSFCISTNIFQSKLPLTIVAVKLGHPATG